MNDLLNINPISSLLSFLLIVLFPIERITAKPTEDTEFRLHITSPGDEGEALPAAPSGLTVSVISSTTLEIQWVDNATDETGFRVERSTSPDSGFETFAMLPANATYLKDFRRSPNTTYFYRVGAINESGESDFTAVASATTTSLERELPYYWSRTDLGDVDFNHNARYDNGFFSTSAQGWFGSKDNGQLMYQPLKGDGTIIADMVYSLNGGYSYHGLTVREDLSDSSRYVALDVNNYSKYAQMGFRRRAASGGERSTFTVDSSLYQFPIKLKLERSGNEFIGSFQKNDGPWVEFQRETLVMDETVFIGIHSYSNRVQPSKPLSYAQWRDVYVTLPADELAPPSGLVAQPGLFDEMFLSWEDNSNNETGFRIERALKGDTIIFQDLVELGSNVTSYTEDGLELGQTYYYRVRAINENGASEINNERKGEILEVPNTTLLMQRLMGDYDRTSLNNVINVQATADTVNNTLQHPGMLGKQIDVSLEKPLTATGGTLSMRIMPNTSLQTTTFFTSDVLSLTQDGLALSLEVNGTSRKFDVVLDSVTCNHILLRFDGGVLSPYVNGVWFDDISVGALTMDNFTLNEFNGKLWEIHIIDNPVTDEMVHQLSERCTNEVEPLNVPYSSAPYRNCGVYMCLWEQSEELLEKGRKRAYLAAQELAYDKNVFDIGMYPHPDLEAFVNRDMNVVSIGFDYYGLNNILTKDQANTQYWLHENFHAYQSRLYKGGKWLAEASADWASWNYYEEPLKTTAAFTIYPHYGILEPMPPSTGEHGFVRFYHAAIFLAYFTHFVVEDESFIGDLYNLPLVEQNAFLAMEQLLQERGGDFRDVFAEFAIRTSAWDYPDTTISDAFKAEERKGLNVGRPDLRFADILDETGTYGVFQNPLKDLVPGALGWNTYRIDSTAASTYTIRFRGDTDNVDLTEFKVKVATGTGKGHYQYVDIPISKEVALGNEIAQMEIAVDAGQHLFLTVVPTPLEAIYRLSPNQEFNYEFSIESSAHILPDNHIQKFVLEDEIAPAEIDHEQLTVDIQVARGTDASKLTPEVILAEGATSDPENGATLDFTEPVNYEVTGASGASKDWTVHVDVVPYRSETEILSFGLEGLNRLATINDFDHEIDVNLISEVNLSEVTALFTLSPGATSEPASGETIDLSSPITITVTAEDGQTTQEWTVTAKDFIPFITTWETTEPNQAIELLLYNGARYDFRYSWKNAAGQQVRSGNIFVDEGEGSYFSTTFPDAGIYTLEIKGAFHHLSPNSLDLLKDVNQWGDVVWGDMSHTFSGWQGERFSATDTPYLREVQSFYNMFRNAKNFNGDLSQWDTRSVKSMANTFRLAKSFNSDISNWDVGNVTTFEEMFREADAFNADIGQWNVENVINMTRMFFAARSFDHDLGAWNITNVTLMTDMSINLSPANYDRTLIGWAEQQVRHGVPLNAGGGSKYCMAEEARKKLIEEKSWVIKDGGKACSTNGADIIHIELDGRLSFPDINQDSFTVAIPVDASIDLTAVSPTIILSSGATSSPSSGEVVDFTNSVTYTVTSQDGTVSQEWVVTLIPVSVSAGDGDGDGDGNGNGDGEGDPTDITTIQNILTLNGDGINEEWLIEPFQGLDESDIKVFNKSGMIIYASRGYETPWDGTHNGSYVSEGVYYFLIKGPSTKKSGYILVTR